jgi:hypothetical protein
MFERINRRDVVIASLLMVLIYSSMAVFLPPKQILHCSDEYSGISSDVNSTNTANESDRYVPFTRNGVTYLIVKGEIILDFSDNATSEEITSIHTWLLERGAKIYPDGDSAMVRYEVTMEGMNEADLNWVLDYLEKQPSVSVALPNFVIWSPEQVCASPTYEEPFPQYYNLRLLLMLLAGPVLYVFRNRAGGADFIEAMVLLSVVSLVLFALANSVLSPWVVPVF